MDSQGSLQGGERRMTVERVIFHLDEFEGYRQIVEVNRDAFRYILKYISDYKSLIDFLEIGGEWTTVEPHSSEPKARKDNE